MVKRLSIPFILITMFVTLAWPAHAESELTVEPDRTSLYEGEVLTLTVRGSMQIDINLGNLFDLDISNLPSPDTSKLEDDFEIVGRNQRYSIRTVNSEMVGEITWTYQLAPKKTGKLTIPPLTFQNASSEPVQINVMAGTSPDQEQASRDSFIELSTDKDEVYVQEQLVLTIRLFFNGNLIRGELSEPEHPNAIIETLGKQREYSRYRNGVRFRVVERRYAIYPQKPGEFSLNTIVFEGRARTPEGQLKFLRDSEKLFDIPVKDVPASFSGDTWLPAGDLELSESGLPDSQSLSTGQNLTRTLALNAQGLPAEALPPFPEQAVPGIRTYPEQPERSASSDREGITSTLTQTTALVPVEPGNLLLPEIRIPWWDTKADEEQVAVIPARTLSVSPSPDLTTSSGQTTSAAEKDMDAAAQVETERNTVQASTSWFWPMVSLILALGWLATVAAWWFSRKRQAQPTEQHTPDNGEKELFRELCQAAEKGNPRTLALLPRWATRFFHGQHFDSVADVCRYAADESLNCELEALQSRLFGRHDHTADWDGSTLVAALKALRGKQARPKAQEGLPPLYPEGLASQ
ncbi:BatD family protein [uncultured Marinobacter sp.]|uniref:BatD family protein n=1 Tax=uncultured Marinobacter sp. TaxID=187379 RepID=UPI00262F8114|nr:BatD family protein [uncultured Marinobacter sp.]